MNKTLLRFGFLLILIPTVALAAGRQETRPRADGAGPDSAWPELMASMEKMHAAMANEESSGNADIDFVKLMLPHHQAAIEMAKVQLLHGTDPQMRRLAQEIVTDQQSEIQLMQLWLKHQSANSQNTNPASASHATKEN
jgi:uncharacterized protein (DUF305 family)